MIIGKPAIRFLNVLYTVHNFFFGITYVGLLVIIGVMIYRRIAVLKQFQLYSNLLQVHVHQPNETFHTSTHLC